MFTALTIAGSDSSGGAGIQADIKTMGANGVYAMSAITALTAQNTTGVTDILEATPDFLCAQLDAVFTDIFPDAVKIGMLSGRPIMKAVFDKLCEYNAKHIVLDPVMVATSGSRLMKEEAAEYLMEHLVLIAEVITPNIPETEILTGMSIQNMDDMIKAGNVLYKKINDRRSEQKLIAEKSGQNSQVYEGETAVLVKGGHSIHDATDILFTNSKVIKLEGQRIDNPNTHGTGCTLSSAIASNLAKGYDLETSVRNAKEYLTSALRSMLDLGHGSGPVNHFWRQEDTI